MELDRYAHLKFLLAMLHSTGGPDSLAAKKEAALMMTWPAVEEAVGFRVY
jgi:hypothetical protein